jgi:hypothetical protein
MGRRVRMSRATRAFALTALGLVIVNVATVVVVVGCMVRAQQASAIEVGRRSGDPPHAGANQTTVRSSARDQRTKSSHLMFVLAVIGVFGSIFFTGLLAERVRELAHVGVNQSSRARSAATYRLARGEVPRPSA